MGRVASALPSLHGDDLSDHPALASRTMLQNWHASGFDPERCACSGPVIIAPLLSWGLEPLDIEALERLSGYGVRRRLGTSTIDCPHGDRRSVIAYLRAWADLLEERLDARRSFEAA
jgi:hypothetical protein